MPSELAEEARATFSRLCPTGWEEREHPGELELATYAGSECERRLREAFGAVRVAQVTPDWSERWREFHRPVRIGPLWVGPPWVRSPADALSVVVDPGMAFGTGAHPTTRLCLELLLEQRPCPVVDIGCGSGVLAIAAVKLGFGPVIAIDCDPAAVDATRANAAMNAVSLDVRLSDVRENALAEVDLALANLELGAIPVVAARFRGKRLISSGYLAGEAARPPGWRSASNRESDGWTAELLERQ